MSSLNEAYLSPLINMTGTHKIVTGDPSQDYPKIIADLILLLCHSNQIEDRYNFRFNGKDLKEFINCAFSSNKQQIMFNFWEKMEHEVQQRGANIEPYNDEPVTTYLEGPVFYFLVSNEYERFLVGFGPYIHPVWLHSDERSKN